MKTIGRILVGVVLTFNSALVSAELTAFEPTAPWLDNNGVHINAHGGGVLFNEGTYYWFGEHKTQGRRGNTAQVGVHVYASTDLYNWKDEGIALAVSEDPDSEIVQGCIIERPKVIYNPKSKKFVMWFHLELKGQGYTAARTAVAVSDSVTGPYAYVRSFRPNAGKLPLNVTEEDQQPSKENYFQRDIKPGQMARDMTLYVDDDGKAYHIAAAEENYTLHVSLLTDDFLDFTGTFSRILIRMHREAPALCKRNGIYYLLSSGCTGWAPNPASYAVADNIFGPYKPMHNPCVGNNPESANGGPELTFGGQSTYILPVEGKKDAFIAMFDVWQPRNPIDGRYIWLPIEFEEDKMVIRYRKNWDLSVFDRQ